MYIFVLVCVSVCVRLCVHVHLVTRGQSRSRWVYIYQPGFEMLVVILSTVPLFVCGVLHLRSGTCLTYGDPHWALYTCAAVDYVHCLVYCIILVNVHSLKVHCCHPCWSIYGSPSQHCWWYIVQSNILT